MDYFVGLDVSLRSAAVCVIDAERRPLTDLCNRPGQYPSQRPVYVDLRSACR